MVGLGGREALEGQALKGLGFGDSQGLQLEAVLIEDSDAPVVALFAGLSTAPIPLFGSLFPSLFPGLFPRLVAWHAGPLYEGIARGGGLIEVVKIALTVPGLGKEHQIWGMGGEMVMY